MEKNFKPNEEFNKRKSARDSINKKEVNFQSAVKITEYQQNQSINAIFETSDKEFTQFINETVHASEILTPSNSEVLPSLPPIKIVPESSNLINDETLDKPNAKVTDYTTRHSSKNLNRIHSAYPYPKAHKKFENLKAKRNRSASDSSYTSFTSTHFAQSNKYSKSNEYFFYKQQYDQTRRRKSKQTSPGNVESIGKHSLPTVQSPRVDEFGFYEKYLDSLISKSYQTTVDQFVDGRKRKSLKNINCQDRSKRTHNLSTIKSTVVLPKQLLNVKTQKFFCDEPQEQVILSPELLSIFAYERKPEVVQQNPLKIKSKETLTISNDYVQNTNKRAQNYLKNHRIAELFEFLGAHLVSEAPGNPIDFLLHLFEKCLNYRRNSNYALPPLLFTPAHVESLFDTMDPNGIGFINVNQYIEGMNTLGVTCDDNQSIEYLIDKETFITNANIKLTENFNRIIKIHRKDSFDPTSDDSFSNWEYAASDTIS